MLGSNCTTKTSALVWVAAAPVVLLNLHAAKLLLEIVVGAAETERMSGSTLCDPTMSSKPPSPSKASESRWRFQPV
jgi:hypothetical protein